MLETPTGILDPLVSLVSSTGTKPSSRFVTQTGTPQLPPRRSLACHSHHRRRRSRHPDVTPPSPSSTTLAAHPWPRCCRQSSRPALRNAAATGLPLPRAPPPSSTTVGEVPPPPPLLLPCSAAVVRSPACEPPATHTGG
jgi:hypothetical protein